MAVPVHPSAPLIILFPWRFVILLVILLVSLLLGGQEPFHFHVVRSYLSVRKDHWRTTAQEPGIHHPAALSCGANGRSPFLNVAMLNGREFRFVFCKDFNCNPRDAQRKYCAHVYGHFNDYSAGLYINPDAEIEQKWGTLGEDGGRGGICIHHSSPEKENQLDIYMSFLIRNCLMQLWSLTGSKISSWQAGDPG